MDRSTRLYGKAIKYYNEGYIEKSLDYCEKSISENIKNTSAINLKGLLYYIKGELEGAQALWKMNFQVNRNAVGKKYLDDSRYDEGKRVLYMEALKAFKELKIREALDMLDRCAESDFNSINVNNLIALCYIKLGQYNDVLRHINNVFKTDRKNEIAHKTKKELIALGVVKRDINLKYAAAGAAVLVVLVGAVFAYTHISQSDKYVDKPVKKNEQLLTTSPAVNPSGEVKKTSEEVDKQTKEIKNEESFPQTQAEEALENKDYEKLYELYSKWQNKELTLNQKSFMAKLKEILSTSGVEYFYNSGREAILTKDYKSAVSSLQSSLSLGEGHYLYSHTIYLLGVSSKGLKDMETSIKYYKLYDSKYPNGDYEEAVLYDLALIYKNINNTEAKSYAKKLSKCYPKSIYNNSIINSILAR